jgi:NAD(P)H dehydrogenase (quinone)
LKSALFEQTVAFTYSLEGFTRPLIPGIFAMNALIVLAHPEPHSFNAHLACLAREALRHAGHDVEISDLYAQDFDPREGSARYSLLRDQQFFDAQVQQRYSWDTNTLPPDVSDEIAKIRRVELVVVQFPLWWFGMPAILKGWMDRVFVYGALYTGAMRHETGVCRGKKALFCVTTGSSEDACSYDGQEGDTELILWPSMYAFRYLGFTVLRPFIINGVRSGLQGQKKEQQETRLSETANHYRAVLNNIETRSVVQYNAASDWMPNGKLKADAPVFSPFVRHHQ